MTQKSKYLGGPTIEPKPLDPNWTVAELIDDCFHAYNAARLREACQLLTQKILDEDVTIGMSLTGALTPAGLARSCLIPLMEAGFVDWIVTTGANLYHDAHFGIGHKMHRGSPFVNDVALHEDKVVRIYDVFFEFEALLDTDQFFQKVVTTEEFQRDMSTAEFHNKIGKYMWEREEALGIGKQTIFAAAHRAGVPLYTSSPGDSAIGMNIASMALNGNRLKIDVSADVNETAAIVLDAKRRGGKAGAVMLGGGSPKNFVLQTEPQIQEVLGIEEKGFDYFIQMTDARPDTGGLSGATPSEAVSWGKVDPEMLPDTVVVYMDTTIGLPLLTSYALGRHEPRKPKRLYDRREEMVQFLTDEYHRVVGTSLPPPLPPIFRKE
jgi:deoxyhypusine synthase